MIVCDCAYDFKLYYLNSSVSKQYGLLPLAIFKKKKKKCVVSKQCNSDAMSMAGLSYNDNG